MCCQEGSGCQHSDRLEGKPEECSEEQIQECHGEVEKHPCEGETGSQ